VTITNYELNKNRRFSDAVHCVLYVGSVEDPHWRKTIFSWPQPWNCDEIMPSPEDMQALGKFVISVSDFNFCAGDRKSFWPVKNWMLVCWW